MAKLVIGTNKQTVVPAVVQKVTPAMYIPFGVSGTGYLTSVNEEVPNIDFSLIQHLSNSTVQLTGAFANNTYISGVIDLSNLVDCSAQGLYNTFSGCTHIKGVKLNHYMGATSSWGDYSFYRTFMGCTGLKTIDFPTTETFGYFIKGQYAHKETFKGCTGLTSISMPQLRWASASYACQSMFENCTGITTVSMNNFNDAGNTGTYQSYRYNKMFKGCTSLSSVSMPVLKGFVGDYSAGEMFANCSSLTTLDMSKWTTINGSHCCDNMFYNSGITSVDLGALTTISGQYACYSMFNETNVASVSFDALTTLNANEQMSSMFYKTSGSIVPLTAKFPSLTSINAQTLFNRFAGGDKRSGSTVWFYALTPSSFGTRTNQFNNMFEGATGNTVHFPIAVQSTIGSWSDITGGLGGTNTNVMFDIVTSLTGADSNTYTRSEKDSTSTATAWTYNSTLYYTSGTTEPQLNDTIYSDSACTTAVTTISSIA